MQQAPLVLRLGRGRTLTELTVDDFAQPRAIVILDEWRIAIPLGERDVVLFKKPSHMERDRYIFQLVPNTFMEGTMVGLRAAEKRRSGSASS